MDLAAEGTNDCVRFFKFCDKFDIGELAATAKESFEDLIDQGAYYIKADAIAELATVIHESNPILDLLYRCYIRMLGHDEHEYYSGRTQRGRGEDIAKYPSMLLMKSDDRVAAESCGD